MAKRSGTVRYTAPLFVTIVAGRIVRVVVDDEQAELIDEVTPGVREVLDTREWPPWEFGW